MRKVIILIAALSLILISCEKSEDAGMETNNVLLKIEEDPTVSFNIWFKVGSVNDPEGKEGLAYITAQMLADASTTENSYSDILEKLYPMAAGYSAKVDKEMTVFRGRTHKDNLSEYKKLLTDAILKPAFNEEDFNRIKNNTINYIENELRYSSDEELGKFSLYGYIFRGTPYEHLTSGTVEGLKNITLEDVKDFYNTQYNKNNFVVGLGGGFDEALVDELNNDLSGLSDTTTTGNMDINPEPIKDLEIMLVEKENASTAISFGFPIDVLRGDDDYYPLALFASWFGEHRNQSSHLYGVIREERGMNYGDYAYIERFLNGGSLRNPNPNNARSQQIFEVWIRPVEHKNRHFALRAAVRELEKVVTNGMTKEQFETTKQFLHKYYLHKASTTSMRLGYQVDSEFYGVEDGGNFIEHFRNKIENLTLKEVNDAIQKHLNYQNIKIAMVTSGAEEFKNDLITNAESPVEYSSEKPAEVLEEDKEIQKYQLNVNEEAFEIVPVEEMFQK